LKKGSILPPLLQEITASLFRRPSTRRYPYVKIEVPEGLRGRMHLEPERCISCGLCARDCPSGAIELVEVSGKKMPSFHLDICIFCYQCVENCPRSAIIPSNFFEMASTDKGDLVVLPTASSSEKPGEDVDV